jgi:ferrous iron transport protein B
MQTLLSTMASVIAGETLTQPKRVQGTPEFQRAVDELVPLIQQLAPNVPNPRWIAIRLLDGDAHVQAALQNGELMQVVTYQRQADARFSGKIALEGRQ